MNTLGQEVFNNATKRIGEPFRHHFRPINVCEGGTITVDECMERGMVDRYDCSGLAIASLCEALGLNPTRWPRELRHTQQLATLPQKDECEPGDFKLYYLGDNKIHIGVATDSEEAIHASGLTGIVERSVVINPKGEFEMVRAIAIDSLARIARLTR